MKDRRPAIRLRALAAAGVSLSLGLTPALARAADQEGRRDAPGVVLRVDSIGPDQSVAIEIADKQRLPDIVSQCFDKCEVVLAPGRYRLRLRTADDETIMMTGVDLTEPVAFHVVQFNSSAKSVGLGLGVAGSMLAGTGLASLVLAGFSGYGPPCDGGCGVSRAAFIYGAIAAPVGGVSALIGWGMFLMNRGFFRREDIKAQEPADARPGPRVGVAATAGAATAGLTLPF